MLVTQLVLLIIYKILGVRHFLQKIFVKTKVHTVTSFPEGWLGLIETQLYKVTYSVSF